MSWLDDKISTWSDGKRADVGTVARVDRLVLGALVARGGSERVSVDLGDATASMLCVVAEFLRGRSCESKVYDAFDRVQERYIESCSDLGEEHGNVGAWADVVYTASYCVLWEVYVAGWATGSVAEDDMPSPVAEGDDGLWLDLVEMIGRVVSHERDVLEQWVASGMSRFASGGGEEMVDLICLSEGSY